MFSWRNRAEVYEESELITHSTLSILTGIVPGLTATKDGVVYLGYMKNTKYSNLLFKKFKKIAFKSKQEV
jgi:hypothetical protein